MNKDAFEVFDQLTVKNPNGSMEAVLHGFTVYPDEESMIEWASEALRTGEFEIDGNDVQLINVAVIETPRLPDRNIARLTFMFWK